MSDMPPKKPSSPPRTGKLAEREAALRGNLLKRKQQQRARENAPAIPDKDKN